MNIRHQTVIGTALLLVAVSASNGCKDKRIDRAPAEARDITVEAPGADVHVGSNPTPSANPRPGEGIDVNVGPGGVQVDVEGTRLRERLQEKRSEPAP